MFYFSLEVLLSVSPLMLIRNADLNPLIDHLHKILCEPQLFPITMQLLSRLLSTRDEKSWVKIIEQLSQNTKMLMSSNKLAKTSKLQFVDFLLQVSAIQLSCTEHTQF